MNKILVIHPGALGDVLLALPALACLRAAFPRAELALAAATRISGLFQGTPLVDRIVSVETLRLHECFADSPLSRETTEGLTAYDVIVSWFGSRDPTYRRQLEGLGRRAIVARATPPPGIRIHAACWLLRTLEPLGISSFPISAPPLPVAQGATEEARGWAAAHGLSMDQVVAVHPGSGAHAKCWPAERFAALVGWIETVVGGPVVLIEGPADAVAVSSVLSRLERTPPVARDFPLPLQAAFFAGASLFIGNDSGLTHLAGAVHAPTIALFGPTDPAIWAPLGPHVTIVAGAGDPADPWGGVSVERVQYAIQSRWDAGRAGGVGDVPLRAPSPAAGGLGRGPSSG